MHITRNRNALLKKTDKENDSPQAVELRELRAKLNLCEARLEGKTQELVSLKEFLSSTQASHHHHHRYQHHRRLVVLGRGRMNAVR